MRRLAFALVALLLQPAAPTRAAGALEIYFVDVEGGKATLIVTPARRVVSGRHRVGRRHGRDAKRIMAAIREARADANRLPDDHALPQRSRRRRFRWRKLVQIKTFMTMAPRRKKGRRFRAVRCVRGGPRGKGRISGQGRRAAAAARVDVAGGQR